MEYQIVLPPELGVTAEAFAASWNAEPQTRAAGEARLSKPAQQQYDWGTIVQVVLIPLAVGISTNAFYDLIKSALPAGKPRKRTQLIEQRQADGSSLLIITIEEE